MPVVTRNHIDLAAAITSGAKAADAEWLAADIPFGTNSVSHMIRLFFSVDKSAAIEFTLDSGDNWFIMNKKTSVVANEIIISYVPIRLGDLLNFRTPEVGGATVNFFRADYVDFESGARGTL